LTLSADGQRNAAKGVLRTLLNRFHLLILAATVGLLAACGKPRGFESAYAEKELNTGTFRTDDAAALKSALEAEAAPLESLWVKMGVTPRQRGKRMSPSFTATAIYQAGTADIPEYILLGFSRRELGTLFTVLVSGDRAQFYANQDRHLFEGSISDLAGNAAVLGGLSPRDLVSAVAVRRELATVLGKPGTFAIRDRGTHLLVATRHATTGRQYFWLVRKLDALVEEVLIRTPAGAEEVRVAYPRWSLETDPAKAAQTPWPSRIEITIPAESILIEADVREYRFDREYAPPPRFKPRETYALRDLRLEGGP